MNKFKAFFCGMLLLSAYTHASLAVDRTRIIYDAVKPGVSVVVENTDTNDPFLMQAWIETPEGQKITEPLIALPLLQRIEPSQKKQVRINTLSSTTELPQDQETLFYFNVLGIPPKSAIDNVVEIVIQSRFKLFYRPKGLTKYIDNNWPQELKLERKANELVLTNPTPYHIVVININNSPEKIKDFTELLLKPKSTTVYPLSTQLSRSSKIVVVYIDDYGAAKLLEYACEGLSCVLNNKP